jgi:hypothetical protein
MEELHSTGNLDKEILDEANKKARKLLKAAEEQIKASGSVLEKRLDEQVTAEKKRLDDKLQAEKAEIETALRRGRRRIQIDKLNSVMHDGLQSFLSSHSRAETLSILRRELEVRLEALSEDIALHHEAIVTIIYRDLSADERQALLKEATCLERVKIDFREAGPKFTVSGAYPAVVLDTGKMRVTASVDIAAENLILNKRRVFFEALVGKDMLDGEEKGKEEAA